MSPSPFGPHQHLLFNLGGEIRHQLKQNECDAFLVGELDWIVTDDTVIRPDIMVGCGPPPSRHLLTPPSMVAEILSPSTQERDQTYKRDLYERHGVATYLILDPKNQTVVQYTLHTNGKYVQQPVADELSFSVCGDYQINLDRRNLFE